MGIHGLLHRRELVAVLCIKADLLGNLVLDQVVRAHQRVEQVVGRHSR
jgi:hypothetical protein